MKKVIFIALLAAAALQPAMAQQPGRGNQVCRDASYMLERLDRRLQLDEKQEKEIGILLDEFWKDYRCNPDITRAECQKQRNEVDKKILKVLNKEQRKEYKYMMERRGNGPRHNHPHQGRRNNCGGCCR